MIRYMAKMMRTISLIPLLSCSGPILATRSYAPGDKAQNAYLDIKDMLSQVCGDFSIGPGTGFHCEQNTTAGGIVSHFRWEEIVGVKCRGRQINIYGKYDSSIIYTQGWSWDDINPQCIDLEKALKYYVDSRKMEQSRRE